MHCARGRLAMNQLRGCGPGDHSRRTFMKQDVTDGPERSSQHYSMTIFVTGTLQEGWDSTPSSSRNSLAQSCMTSDSFCPLTVTGTAGMRTYTILAQSSVLLCQAWMLVHIADEDERRPTGLSKGIHSRSTLDNDVRLFQHSFRPVVQFQHQITVDDDA